VAELQEEKETTMKARMTKFAVAGTIALLSLSTASAQSDFDSKKFFEELQLRGVKTQGIDPEKFFEELRMTGASAQSPLDPEAFWRELATRGASAPANFDARRFFDDLATTGAKAPSMVKPTK